jgi:hypothetical protein
MQQFRWMSLVDAMFLESALRRDVVEILIEGLGLDPNQPTPVANSLIWVRHHLRALNQMILKSRFHCRRRE